MLTEAEAEARLRRTFALRALDAPVPGDGEAGPDGAEDDGLLAFPTAPRGRPGPAAARGNRPGARVWGGRPRTRVLGLAAAVLVVAGVAAALVATDTPDRSTTAAEEADVTASGMRAPEDADPRRGSARPVTDDYPVALYQRGESVLHVTFLGGVEAAPAGYEEVPGRPMPTWATAEQPGGLAEAYVLVEGGAVLLEGAGTPRDDLLAAADTIALDRITGGYTLPPPEGWGAVWTAGPDAARDPALSPDERSALEELGEAPSDVAGRPLGGFARPLGAGGYEVRWFEGAERPDLPPTGVPVDVGPWPGVLDQVRDGDATVAIDVLWVLYDDGALRVEGAGLTDDQLVAAAERVTHPTGGDEFSVVPLDGFEPVEDAPAGG
jgi:hypothetical protein